MLCNKPVVWFELILAIVSLKLFFSHFFCVISLIKVLEGLLCVQLHLFTLIMQLWFMKMLKLLPQFPSCKGTTNKKYIKN